MSEEGGGKMRAKRSHAPAKPYDRRKSFLSKMTDKVMEFIKPSWLSEIGSSSKRQDNSGEEDQEDVVMVPQQSLPQQRQMNQRDGQASRPPPVFTPLTRNGIPTQFSPPDLRRPGLHSDFIASSDPMQSTMVRSKQQLNIPMQPKFTVPQPVNPPTESFTSRPGDNTSVAGFTSSQLPLTPRQFKQNGDNSSDVSNTTSGCSSMIPQPPSSTDTGQVSLLIDQQGLSRLKENFKSSLTQQNVKHKDEVEEEVATSSKIQNRVDRVVTWTSQINSKRKPPSTKYKPEFDLSLFGSPNLNTSTVLSDSIYYPGKTTFGGASAHRKSKLNTSLPYQTSVFPLRQKMKVKAALNTSGPVTSSTARKILESLEKMSTPLSDAKKIPLDDTVTLANRSMFTPGSYKPSRHSIGSYMGTDRELQTSRLGPPTKKISVLSNASICRNHQRYIPPVVSSSSGDKNASRKEPSTNKTPMSSNDDTAIISASASFSGKMKNKKFQQHQSSSKHQIEDEEVEVPELKTDFTLPVSQIPQFNFGEMKTSSSAVGGEMTGNMAKDQKFSFSSPIQKLSTEKTDEELPPKLEFKFSSPIKVDKSPVKNMKAVTFDLDSTTSGNALTSNFTFSPSGPSIKSSIGASPIFSKKDEAGGFAVKPAGELKSGSVMDVLGKSSSSDAFAAGGIKTASELKQGSVMDILGKNSSKSSSETSKPLGMLIAAGTWTCDTCLVQNKPDVVKCAACQTPKSGAKTAKKSSSDMGKPLGMFTTTPAGTWTCNTCLVQNKPDVVKCLACQTPKPGANIGLQKSSTKSNDLSSMFKPKSGSWTCEMCLVSNNGDDIKCAACQTPKPGAKTDLQKSSIQSNDLASMFKPKSGSWTCDVCMVSNKGEDVKCAACQTPKPGAKMELAKTQSIPKKPKENWECDTCLVPNKADAVKCIACEAPRPGSQPTGIIDKKSSFKISGGAFSSTGGFSFGSSSSSTKPAAESGFKFGDSNSTSDSKKETKDSGFKFGGETTSVSETKTEGFVFGKTDSTNSSTDKNLAGGFKFGQSTENKTSTDTSKTEGIQFGKKTDNSSESDSKKSGFAFGQQNSESSAGVNSFGNVNCDNKKENSSESTFKPVFGVTEKTSESNSDKISNSSIKTNSIFGQTQKSELDSVKGGFSFGSNLSQGSTANSAPLGGFSSMPKTGIQNTEQPKPFSLGSTSQVRGSSAQLSFNGPTTASSDNSGPKLKRGRDDDDGPTDAKKPTTSNLFQFGANPVTSTTATVMPVFGSSGSSGNQPVFGNSFVQSNSTAPPTGTTGFGSAVSNPSSGNASLFGFGAGSTAASSTATSTTASAGLFAFGATGTTTTAAVSAPANSGVFTFGGNSAVTTSAAPTANPGVFAFGAGNTASANPSSNKVFNFGGTNNATGTSGTSAPAFNFTGQTTSSSQQPIFGMAANTAAPATGSNPVFGAATTTSTTASPFAFSAQPAPTQNAAAPTPVFGSTTGGTSVFGSSGSFGGASSAAPSPFSSGFGTGTSSTPAFGGDAKPSFGTTPSFGSTATTTPSAGGFNFNPAQSNFNFGGSNAAQPGTPAANPGIFQFGAGKPAENAAVPSQPQAAPTGGFSFSATPSMNFGAAAPSQPGTPGSFTMGVAPTTDSSRKIKKAVRKIRR